jgi:SulP family sulfate permease
VQRAGLGHISKDGAAAVTGAIASVPDGMASSVIIGVNPIHGLYASAFGPIAGGLTAPTVLLVFSTTSAGSLAAADVVSQWDGNDRLAALLMITALAGVLQLLAGAIGFARLTTFVSHSVMTGFLTGIAVLIIVGQAGNLVGYDASGANAVTRTWDLITHAGDFELQTIAMSLLSFAVLLGATRAGPKVAAPLFALAVPSLLVAIAGLDDVALVKDIGSIPSSLPSPALPDFDFLTVSSLTGAVAVAAIVFVQTAGVSQALPGANPRGVYKQDLMASGVANVVCSLMRGQPVGGSMGQSAVNVQSGARTRWAAVLSGVFVLVIVLLLGSIVEQVVMASLAAILVTAAVGAIDLTAASSVWQAGWNSRLPILFTFLLTLLLPIQLAVLGGVLLSAVLYLASSSADVNLVELVMAENGEMREEPPPKHLRSESVLVLQVYGSLFYAGARTLARRLPEAGGATKPIVILRLRGKSHLGATVIEVLCSYANSLQARGGHLYLAGIGPDLRKQLLRGKRLRLAGVRVFGATPTVGSSLQRSYKDARTWLVQIRDQAA